MVVMGRVLSSLGFIRTTRFPDAPLPIEREAGHMACVGVCDLSSAEGNEMGVRGVLTVEEVRRLLGYAVETSATELRLLFSLCLPAHPSISSWIYVSAC